MSRSRAGGVVIAHLFPDLLNLYGDRGNVETLVRRATWRGLTAEVRRVNPGDAAALRDVDVIFVGGGADQQQRLVADALVALRAPLRAAVADGAALLAVCAGYQNLGHVYRSRLVGELRGPGLLDVETDVPVDVERLVGGVVVELEPDSPIVAVGDRAGGAQGSGASRLVGFENHSGRTRLGPTMQPLGRVVVGRGLEDARRDEGAIALPGAGGIAGLRIGTYLHGPLLPRNPHLADFVLACGIARGIGVPLAPIPSSAEWTAHARFEADWRAIDPGARPRSRLGRVAGQLAVVAAAFR
jgi:CobQ-like glutamine amidotransferase family enzyme